MVVNDKVTCDRCGAVHDGGPDRDEFRLYRAAWEDGWRTINLEGPGTDLGDLCRACAAEVAPGPGGITAVARGGFTLIELLVVLAIILIVAAALVRTVYPTIDARRLDAAARTIQGALSTLADAAAHKSGGTVGVRLEPDPAYPLGRLADGRIDPAQILTYSRMVPLEQPEDYTNGAVILDVVRGVPVAIVPPGRRFIEECSFEVDRSGNQYRAEPTSWAWNVRLGDRITFAGSTYIVCGPALLKGADNPEGFVNWGPPGSPTDLIRPEGEHEYLLLVNGIDDDRDGLVDEGWDGIDNDMDGAIDEDDEWEEEGFLKLQGTPEFRVEGAKYSIRRRPAPAQAKGEQLPSGVVIDATTALGDRLRSRLPVDRWSGNAEWMVEPTGRIAFVSPYANPSSLYPYSAPFLHLWVADRGDVAVPPSTKPAAAKLVSYNINTGRTTATDADAADPAAARRIAETGR